MEAIVLLAIGIMIIGYLITGLVKSAKKRDYYGLSKYLLRLLGLFLLAISSFVAVYWLQVAVASAPLFATNPRKPLNTDLKVFDFWTISYDDMPVYFITFFILSLICFFISFWIHRVRKHKGESK